MNMPTFVSQRLSSVIRIKKGFFGCWIFLLCATVFPGTAAELHRTQWAQDINYYADQLTAKHIDPYHSMAQQDFRINLQLLKSDLPQLSENQVLVRMMQLTHKIGDGHTAFPLWGNEIHKLPIRLNSIQGKLIVTATTDEVTDILGSELRLVNGVAVRDVAEQLSGLVPFAENPYSSAVRVAQYATVAEVLNGLGLLSDDYTGEFSFVKNGVALSKTLRASKDPKFDRALHHHHPLSENKIKTIGEGLWFSAAMDKQSVYVKFARYPNKRDMHDFARALLKYIEHNRSQHFIIDLRDNYGGDFFVGLTLAEYLVRADSLDWQSGGYVLINNTTYSAAMSNAAQFSRLLNARLVGEPTGAKPKGFQDLGEFTLPNSNWVVTYSKRYYDFTGSDDDALYPTIPINVRLEDYLAKNDVALNWVLEQVNW